MLTVISFYIVSLLFVGLLVPWDDSRLLGAAGSLLDVSTSPFVIVANNAGIPAFGDFVNVVILCSVVSIGLSGVYGGSRTLTALAEQGYAPKVFTYVDRAGRPLWSTLAILAFGPLGFLTLASDGATVFGWLLALSGLAALFTWGSICLAHIRFRAAWKHQGHSVEELPFKAVFGATGSWIGLILIVLVLIAQFYVSVQPLDAEKFFNGYLAFFVVLIFYAIGYGWKRTAWIKIEDIDVTSGQRELDWEEMERIRAKQQSWPAWRRVADKFI